MISISFSDGHLLYAVTVAICAGLVGGYFLSRRRNKSLKPSKIKLVSSVEDCDLIIAELTRRLMNDCAVGFDCEWVTVQDGPGKGRRGPVSLVQLSTRDGFCGLFRLNLLNGVPDSLKDILENDNIYKLGVGPVDDARYLLMDYSVVVKGALDIRHIAKNSGYESGGLDFLAQKHLNIKLDKNWRVRASDWNAEVLTERQVLYAANDAYVAIKIFEKLLQRQNGFFSFVNDEKVWRNIGQTCRRYADLPFTAVKNINNESNKPHKRMKEKKYSALARSKPLYQNGFMLAPDGELLCTCDLKKAQWYIDKGLAEKVTDEPFTIKLCFEPAGRAVGEVGRYYQLEKENRCVVCGQSNSYIRKNVVPREYRKYFPDIMKDHSSHDIVLLCLRCHQQSNTSDQHIRLQLATQCNAPLTQPHHLNKDKYIEDVRAKTVKSAARALLADWKNHNLPADRRKELETIVLAYSSTNREITEKLLSDLCNTQVLYENENYESHGKKVVDKYINGEGLLTLEKIWRVHFLETMKPKYLPDLWCINHNEERLQIRVQEGRIEPADMKLIGLGYN